VSGILDAIQTRLAPLAPDSVQLADESGAHIGHEGAKGGGGHYRLTIVSSAFRGRTLVARHRMIYDALAPLMQHEIHALAIHAYAPEER
jgi:BolA protein